MRDSWQSTLFVATLCAQIFMTPLPVRSRPKSCLDELVDVSGRSPLKMVLAESLVRIQSAETPADRPRITKSCTKQIRHRILLVLQRLYHEAHETGIISVESFDILDHAIRCALDDDDCQALSRVIEDCFKISKFATMPYRFGDRERERERMNTL